MQMIKKYWLGFVILGIITISGVMIYQKLHPKTLPQNLIQGTGRIDGDLINLNAKYPGRIETISVDDGVAVQKGMIVAKIQSKEYIAKKAQLQAQLDAARKNLGARRIELQIARTSIPQAEVKAKAALQSAKSQMASFIKNLEAQQSVVKQSKRDFLRLKNLYENRLIQKQLLEQGMLKYKTDKDRLGALQAQKKQLRDAIHVAESNLKEATASQQKLTALEASIKALEANITALEAGVAQVDAVLAEFTLHSPVEGYVVEKIANAGEVLGAGMPVATLIDPHSLYLKIFVDTIYNGKIHIGDKAEIFLDATPDHAIAAKVVRIAQKAEFTPKEVSVRSDRIQRVYAVHLQPLQVDPLLKLGIPAIGVITTDGKGLPASLDELPVL